jgi:citrate lyase subunit beta/citryl-CoA lyase
VRLNSLGSGFLADDIKAMVGLGLDFVYLPMLEAADELVAFVRRLEQAEEAAGISGQGPRVYGLVETAKGILNLESIVFSSKRLCGLMFGAEDFTLSLGVDRSREGKELFYPRAKLALCCAAAGLESIDTVYSRVKDPDGFLVEAGEAKQLGFTSKALIHPGQIELLKQVYAPTPEQVESARRQVAGYEEGVAQGRAAVAVDGKMVDPPVYERAKRIIRLDEAIRAKEGV